ncbi:MAG: hypothetical protein AAGL98_06460, partial [Planctomycetota bacterium]
MLRGVRISLANKCQLLFGLAVVLVMTAALTVVGWRMQTLVERAPQRRAQDLAEMWLAGQIDLGNAIERVEVGDDPGFETGVVVSLVYEAEIDGRMADDAFLADAVSRFEEMPTVNEAFEATPGDAGQQHFRYVRAVRASDVARMEGTYAAGVDAAKSRQVWNAWIASSRASSGGAGIAPEFRRGVVPRP